MDVTVEKLLAGDRKVLARMITRIESRDPSVAKLMEEIYEHAGSAHIIGITGPPGAGKSTLTDKLIAAYRLRGLCVAVVAIDPSSPFSGGALLGDRVRMGQHAIDQKVFIRSVGSRGSQGGLSRATGEIVGLMSAAGFDVVIVETVGVGQTELDIMDLADTVIVVFVPESGDVVQTMKAGLTEIADVFVVNKSDRDGADAIVRELRMMIEIAPPCDFMKPVITTVAIKSLGIDDLMEALDEHKNYLACKTRDDDEAGHRRISRFIDILSGIFQDRINQLVKSESDMGAVVREVYAGELNPYTAARRILENPELITELVIPERVDH